MAVVELLDDGCPAFSRDIPAYQSLGAIDRIGLAFCESPQKTHAISELQAYRAFRMRCLKTTLGIVDACQVPSRAAVSVRLKRLDSIRRKLNRKQSSFRLGRLDDVIGLRIVCESLSTVREFSRRVCKSHNFHRLKDYIETPRSTGYRGMHHIMRFNQPVTGSVEVSMRFEVQVRTVLQHKWAVWSESQGEAVKLGVCAEEGALERLQRCSREIAQWEANNSESIPVELRRYAGGRFITVCWRNPNRAPTLYPFEADINGAVEWLNELEKTFPAERGNALLLVGVANVNEALQLLWLTHPLFAGVPVREPSY